jgi:hypothetical protein
MPYAIQVEWDDVPHLSEAAKKEMLTAYRPHERDARSKGIPILGSGVIYPVAGDTYLCDPFDMPSWWPRAYGMDVGWNKTAAVWGAWDRESDTVYIYSEHYQGQLEPSLHADSIRARGDWIPGAIDPASAGAGQTDGKRLLDEYRKLGLILQPAENAVEAGIHAVWQRLAAGRLKIFNTCRALVSEIRLYRRDENGKVVKENDHAVDALRYLIMTGMMIAQVPPFDEYPRDTGEEGRSSITGY